MAVDTTDGCLPNKMSPLEDMEVGSEGQESYGLVSQEARGASPGSAGDSQSQIQSSQEVMILLYPVTKVIQGRSSELAAYIKCSNYHNS